MSYYGLIYDAVCWRPNWSERAGPCRLVPAKVLFSITRHRPGALFHMDTVTPRLGCLIARLQSPFISRMNRIRLQSGYSLRVNGREKLRRRKRPWDAAELAETYLHNLHNSPLFVISWVLTKGRLRRLPIGKSAHRSATAMGQSVGNGPVANSERVVESSRRNALWEMDNGLSFFISADFDRG